MLNSKENYVDITRYIRQKQVNETLQANLTTRTTQVNRLETELEGLRDEIQSHIKSKMTLQSSVNRETIQKESLQKDIDSLRENLEALRNDKRLLVEALARKQQDLDVCKNRNKKLLAAIKSVDSTIDGLSDTTMRESSQ